MLSLSIISPEKKIFEAECSQVTIPTESGLITVLPSHAPLFSLLNSGEVEVKSDQKELQHILVSGGFVSVINNKVDLLVDFGIHSDELDEKIILAAKERAEKMIAESKSEDYKKAALASLLHADLQLKFLANHRKHHKTVSIQ